MKQSAPDPLFFFSSQGIRFECQGSGKCCVSRGEYGYVYVALKDRQRFAKILGLSTTQFTLRYCAKTDGYWHLKSDPITNNCVFLKGKQCSAYEGRPDQCRTWPFWPELMNAKTWAKDVASFCPGVGKGKLWSVQEINAQLKIQQDSEDAMSREPA